MNPTFTQDQINKIQEGDGICVVDLDETTELVLGPIRGGIEFVATPTYHDIEFDGRKGKTKGMQVKDGEDATLKVKTLCCSLDTLALALPTGTKATGSITSTDTGVVASTAYRKNVAVISKTVDGTYRTIKLFNPMHEGAFNYKSASKSENEHSLEFIGHYDPTSSTGHLYDITDSTTNPLA